MRAPRPPTALPSVWTPPVIVPPCAPHASIVSLVQPLGTVKVCTAPVALNVCEPALHSVMQLPEQPSPAVVLPSSHCSPGSSVPLPQVASTAHVIVQPS